MTILAKMHDKMAITAKAAHQLRPVPTQPAQPIHAQEAETYSPPPIVLETPFVQQSSEPPLYIQLRQFTMPDIFRMFAAAQDEPGRLVCVRWSLGGPEWTLSLTFNSGSNQGDWQLACGDEESNTIMFNSRSRDLTDTFRSVTHAMRGS